MCKWARQGWFLLARDPHRADMGRYMADAKQPARGAPPKKMELFLKNIHVRKMYVINCTMVLESSQEVHLISGKAILVGLYYLGGWQRCERPTRLFYKSCFCWSVPV